MGIKKSLGRLVKLTFILLFISCNPEENEIWIDYVIINESGVEIRIESNPSVENLGSNEPRSDLVLQNNEAFSERIQFTNQSSNIDFKTFFRTDNIDIIYDNNRKTSYSCSSSEDNNCGDTRNILKFGPNSEDRAEYTFTISDFDSAILCNGNCD